MAKQNNEHKERKEKIIEKMRMKRSQNHPVLLPPTPSSTRFQRPHKIRMFPGPPPIPCSGILTYSNSENAFLEEGRRREEEAINESLVRISDVFSFSLRLTFTNCNIYTPFKANEKL
jgi:hypothetical protein